MFGFKIIPEKEYVELKAIADYRMVDRENVRKAIEKLQDDNKALREQLNEKIKEVRNLEGTPKYEKTFKYLKDFYVLHDNNFTCDKCKLEMGDCTKLTFADRTICVCPKNKVNSFRPKKH